MSTEPTPEQQELARDHLDAIGDTGDAYAQFHGWMLGCLWCDHATTGRTKREALALMQQHYDEVIGPLGHVTLH